MLFENDFIPARNHNTQFSIKAKALQYIRIVQIICTVSKPRSTTTDLRKVYSY